MADSIRWNADHGPVLTQTDLYCLKATPALHPLLSSSSRPIRLTFNLINGDTDGFHVESQARVDVTQQTSEPATSPRLDLLYIICKSSPWCTTVRNPAGITIGDVLAALWDSYHEAFITEAEFNKLAPRQRDQIRRTAALNQMPPDAWGRFAGASPGHTPLHQHGGLPEPSIRRVDWLKDRRFMSGLTRDDTFATKQLGFSAPNIFIMELST